MYVEYEYHNLAQRFHRAVSKAGGLKISPAEVKKLHEGGLFSLLQKLQNEELESCLKQSDANNSGSSGSICGLTANLGILPVSKSCPANDLEPRGFPQASLEAQKLIRQMKQ